MAESHPIDRPGELIKEAVATAETLIRPEVILIEDPVEGNRLPALLTRDGLRPLPNDLFAEFREYPIRRKGTSSHTRLDSFIDHVNRFKDGGSAVFASDDPKSPALTAVIDYHPAGNEAEVQPRFGQHRATYSFPLSPEWESWFGHNAKPMAMTDFALFLEDHIVDVLADPGDLSPEARRFVETSGGTFASPSKLIEIARGLQVNESSVVRETRNLSTGEAEILFDSQHTGADGKPLKLPNLFVIAIPVFARSTVDYRLIARLRYRKTPGGLSFWYELWRPDLVFTNAFEEALDRVKAETGLPVFVGKPEA